MAMLSEGSTATQGKYSDNIRRAVDYLVRQSRPNGLIGDPVRDDRYTYGHGFSMLFLSQVLATKKTKTAPRRARRCSHARPSFSPAQAQRRRRMGLR